MSGGPPNGSDFEDWLRRLPETWAYDVFFRAIFVAWFLFIEFSVLRGVTIYIVEHDGAPDAVFMANVIARMAVAIFLATFMAFVILRSRPVGKAPGLAPRLTAFVGTYLMIALPLFPSAEMSLTKSILSATLIFVGNGFAIYILFWLGRSTSLMAEARKLVTKGPYSTIRHPLYIAEELATFGTYLQFASPWSTALLVVHIFLQLRRMHYEEQILRQTFPEYDDYARRTPRLIPGVY